MAQMCPGGEFWDSLIKGCMPCEECCAQDNVIASCQDYCGEVTLRLQCFSVGPVNRQHMYIVWMIENVDCINKKLYCLYIGVVLCGIFVTDTPYCKQSHTAVTTTEQWCYYSH